MIPRMLNKIELDGARGVLVVPLWNTQVWFPKLITLFMEVPVLLPASKNILHHLNHEERHPILSTSRLIDCQLSGRLSDTTVFRNSQQKSSWLRGGQEQENSMHHSYSDGVHFWIEGQKQIQFQPLQ